MGIHRSIVVSQHLNDCYFRHRYTLRAPLQPTRKQTGASWTPILYLSEQVRGLGATRCHAPKEGKRRESRSCFFFLSLRALSTISGVEFRSKTLSFFILLSLEFVYSRNTLTQLPAQTSSHGFCPRILVVHFCCPVAAAAEARKQQHRRRRRLQGSLRFDRLCRRRIVDEASPVRRRVHT